MADDKHLIGVGYEYLGGGEKEFVRGSKKVKRSAKDVDDAVDAVDGSLAGLRLRYEQLAGPIGDAVAATAKIGAGIAVLAAIATSAVIPVARFESGLIGVGKTANIEGAALRSLGADIDELSRRMPETADGLLTIAQSAGQLGVTGAPNILKFTEVVSKLGSASDLAGEEAATALARILNVTGESIDSVDVLASIIVSLGNNFAASERQIARHAGEVARATAVYELGSGTAAAFGATLAAFGVQAELSGSAIGRSFRTIEAAVKGGGKEMQALAKVAGVSGEEIRAAWERGPIEAFELFLKGVQAIDAVKGNVPAALKSIGLAGEEILKVIPVLAKQFDSFAKARALQAQPPVVCFTELPSNFPRISLSVYEGQPKLAS